jgi:adenylate cyclase
MIGVGIGICVLVALGSLIVSRRICRPLLLLEQDMARMQRFDLGADVRVPSRITEIISMERAINNMKNGLRSFKKYVPAELVGELITLRKEAVLGAERRQLTVFFCDIENFTGVTEHMPPEELAQRMGIFFAGLTQIILRQRGTVDKYIGDSIMAFWGAPHPCEDQAARACLAALECRRFVDKISAEWQAIGGPGFSTRFGINTGEAVVGNFGYEERLNYTAMGDSVNVASRLEGLNKEYGTRILISESTFLQAKHLIEARILDRVVVKGKSVGITVYELLGEKGSLGEAEKAALTRFNQGMEAFFNGQRTSACEIFAALAQQQPHDRAVASMLARCRKPEE